jgi:hypothetical protein
VKPGFCWKFLVGADDANDRYRFTMLRGARTSDGIRREYEGRITGFTMGTGQTIALFPPQNATGNFVKIVQRLPVRVEMAPGDCDDKSMSDSTGGLSKSAAGANRGHRAIRPGFAR